MSQFEIVLALLSFVYALALTHLLQGLSDLIHRRHRVRWSATHAVWVFIALVTLVNNWLALIPSREVEWSKHLILLAFATSAIQYFTCSLVMPPITENEVIDLEEFQLRNGWAFVTPYVFMLIPVVWQNYAFRELFLGGEVPLLEFVVAHWPLYVGVGAFVIAVWRKERWLRLGLPLLFGTWALVRLLA